ncbi:MAG: hypothetical protein NC930_08645 [Candidatus Omnitrophica bacterium]|nr:hypothetical protein [Candidatus Omnitrophota bacterium]
MNIRKLSLAISNIIPATFVMLLAQANFIRFFRAGGELRVSHLLLACQLVLISFFFIARYAPKIVSWHPWDIFISFTGTFAPFFFSLGEHHGVLIKPSGIMLQILGDCLTVYAVLSLNRSIGILPANRGIQTQGMYRFIRHPFYASYQVANLGYLINHPSFYNLEVALLGLLSQILRILSEERLLTQDPVYVEYQSRVRWRMIPFIF